MMWLHYTLVGSVRKFGIAINDIFDANSVFHMNLTHITSQSLRRLLSLTDKKEQLLKSIEEVENEIKKALTGAQAAVVEAVTPAKARKKKSRKSKAKTAKPVGLKERVLALLEDAGAQGLKVKDVAEKLGAKTGNISVWFSTTGKKLTTKLEPGRYAVKSAVKSKPAAKAGSVPSKPATRKKSAKKVTKKPSKKGFKLPKAGKTPF